MRLFSKNTILISLLFAVCAATASAQAPTTQIADTIDHADGTPAAGTLVISWPAFTTAGGSAIPAGNTSAVIGSGGALSISLVPNSNSTPMGSYYTVVYHLDDGTTTRQYWVVPPSSTPVKISAIESTVLPTSVAMQTVSKSYVDTAIAAAIAGQPLDTSPYVEKAGDTMTGPLVLPGDPVSSNQAADKNYVDENVAAVQSGLGQKVSELPSGTQVVSQPTGTQLDVNNLNDVLYASQYVNGFGNNGIANATGSPDCAAGCQVKVEQDYPANEISSTSALNSQTHITDVRGGRQQDSFFNPLDQVTHSAATAQAIDEVETQSEASLAQQAGTEDPGATALSITQEGLAGGSNLFPEQVENPPYFKMGYSALSINGTYNTQGQHVLAPEVLHCYGVGDCLMGSQFMLASGGFRDSADEGAHPFDLQIHEDSAVFKGTCSAGCSNGSTAVTIAPTASNGTQGDGRFLIDTNPSKTITSASTGGTITGGNNTGPHAFAQFSGTAFPVSVFLSIGQAITSQSNNVAPGTVTVPIATTGIPAGYATNTAAIGPSTGVACVVDQTNGFAPDNYEMAPYTIVDGNHLQLTLNKPHQNLATVAFGGLCGYGIEQTVDTTSGIRQVFPIVGSISATSLYYAGGTTPELGLMNSTSGYLNVSAPIATAVRSGNLVTVTTSGNLPANINGLTAAIAGAADSSYNGSFVVTTTGSNTFTYSQTGANSSTTGGTVAVLTGGFAIYPMAEVLSVFNSTTKAVDGQMTLAPNNVAWAASDTVEEPHFYQEAVAPDVEAVGQFVPRPAVEVRAGLQYQQNNGPGLTGWSIVNAAPTTNYLGYGGTHYFPDAAYEANGVWLRTMNLTAGEQAAITVHCNLHGCNNWNSTYNLFELDSSVGGDIVQYSPSTSNLTIGLRGAGYSFTPTAFNAGTINATTLNGALDAGHITTGTVAAARLPLFGASGGSHAAGAVPDPGPTPGTTRFLREDGVWMAPGGGGGAVSSVNGQTGAVTITPQSIGAQPDTAIVAGASADYTFTEGTGTILHDQSGNGNDGTLASGAQAPTWLGTGLEFSSANRSGVALPAALNGSQTIFLAVYVDPFGTYGSADSITYPYPAMVTSTMTPNLGLNLMIVGAVGAGANFVTGTFSPSIWVGGLASSCNQMLSGFHVFAYILGSSPATDRIFIDGTECPYSHTGSSAGQQTTGNLYLGSSNVGLWASNGFDGNIYRATFYPSALTAQQVEAMSGLFANQVAQHGVPTAPVNALLNSPQLHCIGDSITYGTTASTNWCANLTLTRQPSYTINNWGVPSALLQDETGSEPNRVGQQCQTAEGPAVAIVFSGTNDFLSSGITAQQVVSNDMGEVQTLKRSGCQVFVATMLSRFYGSLDMDPDKDAFDEQLLGQAKAMGADGVVDFAADPNLGADGAYASTTWFNDQTHPTTAGQVRLGQIASNSLNYYYGYTAAQPHLVTANTYTLASGDDFVTAAPTANAAYTMPDCTGPSGAVYTISNPQSAFTLTIQGGASQPINGLTSAITIPPNSTVKLTDVPNPKSVSGCHWAM
ncbi:MAG TPA: SGNH/GDSL hydrolase family protein [Acidobacteriaceae bacterium]|nr:SGNH/GDSL hydrolase family protein [Acidobacteriaceae bacterium]